MHRQIQRSVKIFQGHHLSRNLSRNLSLNLAPSLSQSPAPSLALSRSQNPEWTGRGHRHDGMLGVPDRLEAELLGSAGHKGWVDGVGRERY